jgi:hypothetical protein
MSSWCSLRMYVLDKLGDRGASGAGLPDEHSDLELRSTQAACTDREGN